MTRNKACPHKESGRMFAHIADVKRQRIGQFILCSWYRSVDEWDVWIEEVCQ